MNKYTFILTDGESLTLKGDYIESGQFGARVYVDDKVVGLVPRFMAAWKERDQGCDRCGCKYS